jgi:hypothetical protein
MFFAFQPEIVMAGQSPSKDGRLSTPFVPAIHAARLAHKARNPGSRIGVDARREAGHDDLGLQLAGNLNRFRFPGQPCATGVFCKPVRGRPMGRSESLPRRPPMQLPLDRADFGDFVERAPCRSATAEAIFGARKSFV